jgi:recombination protein RecR
MAYPKLIESLIDQLTKLPGVGRRSAERMIYWMLSARPEDVRGLTEGITTLKEKLRFCKRCNHLTDQEICSFCMDATRDQKTICVVEDPKDVIAVEKSGSYKGVYHVLLGTIAPQDNRGPEDLKIPGLIERVKKEGVKEVIIATDSDNEGEMTSLYLSRVLKPLGVPLSRIGIGIPAGSSLEYVDISTLSMSLTSRREIKG